MTTEFGQWRSVPGVNRTFASSFGYIITWDGRHDRWSVPRLGNINGYGYRKTKVNGRTSSVHILVCSAFLGCGAEGDTVDHINRNRSDNRVSNLRWATRSEQATNKCSAKRRRDGNPVWVWELNSGRSTAVLYDSVYCAARSTGAHASLLRKTAIGEYRQTAGFCACFASAEEEAIAGEEFRPWKNIFVSQYGRMKTFHGKLLRPAPLECQIYATYDNNLFHRIVADVWLDIVGRKKTSEETVDHVNRDVTDNRATNLRWATKSEQRANQSN